MDPVINQKYMHWRFIIPRIAQKTKELGISLIEDDVAEWCAECETDYIKHHPWFIKFARVPIAVTQGDGQMVAKLPCNVYRLMDVYSGSGRVAYENDGSFLYLGDFKGSYVFLNYTGIPLGEDGVPLILRGHEQACTAFCVYQLAYPLAIAQKIPPQIFMMIKDDMEVQVQAARNGYRHIDRGQHSQLSVIYGNMIPKIGDMGLYHEAFKDNGIGSINNELWNP